MRGLCTNWKRVPLPSPILVIVVGSLAPQKPQPTHKLSAFILCLPVNNDIAHAEHHCIVTMSSVRHRLLLRILINWIYLLPDAILSVFNGNIQSTRTMHLPQVYPFLQCFTCSHLNNLELVLHAVSKMFSFSTHFVSLRMQLEQLFDSISSTYTYLLADLATKEAILIDPVLEHAKRDKQLLEELGFQLKYASEWDSHVLRMHSARLQRHSNATNEKYIVC